MTDLTLEQMEELLEEAKEILAHQPQPDKRSNCVGIAFKIGEDYSIRRCIWDGEIVYQQADGEPCTACGRPVKDIQYDATNIQPASACYVWLEPLQHWQLVPLPTESLK